MGPQLITASETAKLLGVCRETLARMRMEGRGPKYIRLGPSLKARCMYPLESIQEWIAANITSSTSEETVSREAKQ